MQMLTFLMNYNEITEYRFRQQRLICLFSCLLLLFCVRNCKFKPANMQLLWNKYQKQNEFIVDLHLFSDRFFPTTLDFINQPLSYYFKRKKKLLLLTRLSLSCFLYHVFFPAESIRTTAIDILQSHRAVLPGSKYS